MVKEPETQRKCILSNKVKDKSELLRFTLLPNGTIIPDFDKKLEGKGFYVSNSKILLTNMVNNIKVGKLLHTNAKAPASLVETVGNLLAQKGLSSLGLARKSGDLTIGFDKTKEAIDKGVVDFVIEATDSSPATRAKLLGKAQDILCFSLYCSAELSSALGFENMMYAAVKKSHISSMVKQNLTRYQTFLNE